MLYKNLWLVNILNQDQKITYPGLLNGRGHACNAIADVGSKMLPLNKMTAC